MVRKKLMNSTKRFKALMNCAKPDENAVYMHNRNPRNLEMMKIAYRPDGYHLEKAGKCYWNKLEVIKTAKGLTAKVQHYTGYTVLQSSTEEWSLAKQLYKTYDKAAYINFGRIFAQRCLEAGIIEVQNFNEAPADGKIDLFLKELESNGLKLTESPQYKKIFAADKLPMDKPWMINND